MFNKIKNILFFLFVIFLFNINIKATEAASLYFGSKFEKYYVNEEFIVDVFLSSKDKKANALSINIIFPKDILDVNEVILKDSIVDLFIFEPKINYENNSINVDGVILNGGFSGENGKILSIKFKAKKRSSFNLNFLDVLVLENDGKGTKIDTYFNEKNFYIINKISKITAKY